MATRGYVPDASEVVWLEFDPQAGHEQAGQTRYMNGRSQLAPTEAGRKSRAGENTPWHGSLGR